MSQTLDRSCSLKKSESIHRSLSNQNRTSEIESDGHGDESLRREQGLISLTAIGVGAVISGDFYGWNYGLERGGFGGLLVSTIIVCFMYISLSLSLAELSSMYPSAEGAFKFSRIALNPYLGFCCGLFSALEYVLLVPVVITALGDHLNLLFEIEDTNYKLIWWSIICILYLTMHLWGTKPMFISNIIFTFITLLTLFIFYCISLIIIINTDSNTQEINERIFNIEPDLNYTNSSWFLPKGIYGIFTSLTFAAWFFIAIEELPVAAEDAIKPRQTIPKSLISSIIILSVSAFLTLILSTSVPGGSYNIANNGIPLVRAVTAGMMNLCVNHNIDGEAVCNNSDLECNWNDNEGSCYDKKLTNTALAIDLLMNLGSFIALLTSCHAIIYASGRQLMSLTRNGIFHPISRFDRITNSTPRIALLFSIIFAFIIVFIVYFIGEGVQFLLSISVAASCISYILSMLSYIKIKFMKIERKNLLLKRYKSPLGIIGAGYAAFISFAILLSFFVDIAINSGYNRLIGILFIFIGIWMIASFEYLGTCCNRKSGKIRFDEFEKRFDTIYIKEDEHIFNHLHDDMNDDMNDDIDKNNVEKIKLIQLEQIRTLSCNVSVPYYDDIDNSNDSDQYSKKMTIIEEHEQ